MRQRCNRGCAADGIASVCFSAAACRYRLCHRGAATTTTHSLSSKGLPVGSCAGSIKAPSVAAVASHRQSRLARCAGPHPVDPSLLVSRLSRWPWNCGGREISRAQELPSQTLEPACRPVSQPACDSRRSRNPRSAAASFRRRRPTTKQLFSISAMTRGGRRAR